MTGRQLARVGATTFREILHSQLWPGNTPSSLAFKPTILALEQLLPLAPYQRQSVLVRLDGGFGTDGNLTWLLQRGYSVLAKGFAGTRAAAQARRTVDWLTLRPGERWAAWAPQQLVFPVPTQTVVVRWMDHKARYKHALYITTCCDLSLPEIVALYDQRGAAEVEIQADKAGLLLARRRKHRLAAQAMLVLLDDLAHNLLALLHAEALVGSRFAAFGPKRIVRDLLSIPAEVYIEGDQLRALRLQAGHPYANDMTSCLTQLWGGQAQS